MFSLSGKRYAIIFVLFKCHINLPHVFKWHYFIGQTKHMSKAYVTLKFLLWNLGALWNWLKFLFYLDSSGASIIKWVLWVDYLATIIRISIACYMLFTWQIILCFWCIHLAFSWHVRPTSMCCKRARCIHPKHDIISHLLELILEN